MWVTWACIPPTPLPTPLEGGQENLLRVLPHLLLFLWRGKRKQGKLQKNTEKLLKK